MESLLAKMEIVNEAKRRNTIFIMDGASIHTCKMNKDFYNDKKIRVLQNHSYCPEFNAIETFIKLHKQRIKDTISVQW